MLDYDPFSPEALADPHAFYPELRRSHPILRLERYRAWALSRFADCWQVLQDHDGFSIVEGPVFSPQSLTRPFEPGAIPAADPMRSFSTWDAPPHTRIRRVMAPRFGPKAVAEMEGRMQRAAAARLDALVERGRFDVVADYAGPFVVQNVAEVLGLDVDDPSALFRAIQRTTARDPGRAGFTPEGLAAQAELTEGIRANVAERRAAPPDDSVLSSLLRFEHAGRPLEDVAIAIQLMTLLTGGSETLPKVLAGGLLQLEAHADQWDALVVEPTRAAAAFEEMMRHQGVLQHVGRTALRDVTIGGVRIPAGDRVLLLLQSANRDERVFERPDAFDIHRPAQRNLALGIGRHHCIGSHLARLEGRVLLETLLARLPHFRVDHDSLVRAESEFQVGYTRMVIESETGGSDASA
jgi:cytochrome P450